MHLLWDQGTWTPLVDDVDAGLKKGDLKFTLDGYKLKGSWVLVRTGGRYPGGGDRSWLLIKHKDEWAGEVDITTFAPKSVKSGGEFADILADGNPEIWISNRPAQGGETGAMFQKIVERALQLQGKESKDLSKESKDRSKDAKDLSKESKEHSTKKPAVKRAIAKKKPGAKKPAAKRRTS